MEIIFGIFVVVFFANLIGEALGGNAACAVLLLVIVLFGLASCLPSHRSRHYGELHPPASAVAEAGSFLPQPLAIPSFPPYIAPNT